MYVLRRDLNEEIDLAILISSKSVPKSGGADGKRSVTFGF